MKKSIDNFEYLTDVSDKIEEYVDLMHKTRSKKEKHRLLIEIKELIELYEKHVGHKVYNKNL